MITKNDLLKYAKQNPSKYAHKFGHVDVDSLPEEGYIDHLISKAKTNLDGTPAKTVQELMAEFNTPAVLTKNDAVATPSVDGGNTLEDNEKKTNG